MLNELIDVRNLSFNRLVIAQVIDFVLSIFPYEIPFHYSGFFTPQTRYEIWYLNHLNVGYF